MKKRVAWVLVLCLLLSCISVHGSGEAVCVHFSSTPVADEPQYTPNGAVVHTVTIVTHYICDNCGEETRTPTTRTYSESHEEFMVDGVCSRCGWEQVAPPPCEHTSTKKELINTEYDEYDDSQHVINHYYKEVCTSCGNVINTEIIETDYEPHTLNRKGKCNTCGYQCPHTSTTKDLDSPNVTYEQDDETYHTTTTEFDIVCDNCGAIVDTETLVIGDLHEYNSDGVCIYCGYKKPADECPVHGTHQYNGDLQYEAEHPHKEYYVCDCGWAEYTGTNHSFTTTANPLSPRYEKNDENGHTVINIYEDVCDLCGQVVNPGREEPAPDKEAHEFDANGTCIKCGYKKPADECPVHGTHQFGEIDYEAAHPHKEFRKCDCGWVEYTGTNYSFTITSNLLDTNYAQHDDNQHTVLNTYEDICALCDTVLNTARIEEYKEAHDFDADGKCTRCDYQKPHVDPGQLQISVSPTQSTAKIGETISASATASGGDGSYKYFWEVFKDGSSVDSTDFNMGGYYSYIANETGTYVFTATVKDGTGATASVSGAEILVTCDHANTETTEVGAPVYVNNGSSGHTRIVNVHIECLDCGEVLEEKKAISEEQPHEFIDGVCVCGQPEHVHNFVNNNDFEAEHHDGLGHKMYEVCDCGATRYTGEYTQWAECCECVGHDWGSPYDGGNGTWYHKCSRCGAEEETENTCDHKLRLIGTSTSYERLTDVKHKKIITSVYCCDCGKMNKTEENNIPEDHSWGTPYDAGDGTLKRMCEKCKETMDVQPQDVYGPCMHIWGKEYEEKGNTWHKCILCGLTEKITNQEEEIELADPTTCEHIWILPYKVNGVYYTRCALCETVKVADDYRLPEEYLEEFSDKATESGTRLNNLYNNSILGSAGKSMFNYASAAILNQYAGGGRNNGSSSGFSGSSLSTSVSGALADQYSDGMKTAVPEELYKMLTDILGYVGEAVTEDTYEEKTITELEYLVKSMLAKQVDFSPSTISEIKDGYSVVETSSSVLAEFIDWSKVFIKVGKSQEKALELHKIGGYTQNTIKAIDLILKSVDVVNCTIEDLSLLASLVANYDRNVTMLDEMIDQCGKDSYIGIACSNVKDDIVHSFKATIDECAEAKEALAGVFLKEGIKYGISELATIEYWVYSYKLPIVSNGKITGTISRKVAINNTLKSAANVAGGILLGGDIGSLITYNTGRFLNAKDQIILMSTIDAQVRSSVVNAYVDESKALLPLTDLWLTTQQAGLDATKEYFDSYADSWYNQFVNGGSVESAKQCLADAKSDETKMKSIAKQLGFETKDMGTVYMIPDDKLSFAGDRMVVESNVATFLYVNPDEKTENRIAPIPKETEMFLLGEIEKNGKKWYKVSYGNAVCYIDASKADVH